MSAIEEIRDFRPISAQLITAGQPTAEQLAAVAAAGVEVVVNLLPGTAEHALADEADRVRALGMRYVHIPVDWEHPRAADFERFAETLRQHRQRRLLAHCAANLRVSAFLALYRALCEGWSWAAAAAELHRVWEPDPVWSEFLARTLRQQSRRRNPWRQIPLDDYEAHMGSEGAGQLAPLSELFGRHCRSTDPARVAVLGCAAGNGFEQLDPRRIERLVGIDLRVAYLREARRRFASWGGRLQLICARAEICPLRAGSLDLVSAGLIFEYCDPALLAARVAEIIAPEGHLSVVLQLPSRAGAPVVSATEQASLRELGAIMRLVPPDHLTELLREQGLPLVESEEIPLPFGKAFHVGLYRKGA